MRAMTGRIDPTTGELRGVGGSQPRTRAGRRPINPPCPRGDDPASAGRRSAADAELFMFQPHRHPGHCHEKAHV